MSGMIRCYDYVNHPYAQVRDVLKSNAPAVFHAATLAADSRARTVASQLHVRIAGVDVATDIAIVVAAVGERDEGPPPVPVTVLRLEWEAVNSPRLFPFMRAELSVYPLTAVETQLDFSGTYEPPLGVLGGAIDAVVGHRMAEASVHRFVAEVAAHLRRTLGSA